ncbi:GNAT family N-acetyltransferase [Cohnella rhizosphaerae]|uniref:GNAT family N-acetyltransferase n=1 Tax=Cohnella rhizosphaerae TaxID=1457232 RepID=UPI0030B8CA26
MKKECFPLEEAATEAAFAQRIRLIPDTFIVAENAGEIWGYINGPVIARPYITDDLFEEIKANPKKGGYQSVLGLAVSREARGQGIAKRLMENWEKLAEENERDGITLTCKADLAAFYEKLGFSNHGRSASQHGGVVWYDLIKRIRA